MPESVADVLNELGSFLNDAAAAEGVAKLGVELVHEKLRQRVHPPENPNPTVYFGIGDPNLPTSRRYAAWTFDDIPVVLADDGPVQARLSQQWVVSVFTAWEHEYRPRLASAHGCPPSDLQYPLLGDLRRLRNDIVHHRGVATQANTGRCEVVHWFSPGDTILVKAEYLAEFMALFPWDAMAAGPAKS